MGLTPETITTKVDQLMELVKQSKEISFEAAAAKLGVSVAVIEAWSSFLEEEGLISVKYNLTTPFLVYAPPAALPVKLAAAPVKPVAEAGSVIMQRDSAVPAAKPAALQGFSAVPEARPSVVSATDSLKRVSSLVRDAEGLLLKNDFDGAEKLYHESRAAFDSLPSGFEKEKRSLNSSLTRLFGVISSKKASFLSRKFSYLSREIEKALPYLRHYVAEDRLEDAVNVYEQIKVVYNTIPDEFAEEKMRLHEQILSVYDQLSTKMRSRFVADMRDKSARINALLDKMSADLKSGSFELANQDYLQINETYNDLPRGFLMEKTALQNRIVRAYEELVSRSGQRVEPQNSAFDKVALLLKKADYYARQHRFAFAIDAYREALLLYKSLPASKAKSDMLPELLRLRAVFAGAAEQIAAGSSAVKPAAGAVAALSAAPPSSDGASAPAEDLSDVKVKISALKMVAAPAVRRVSLR